MGQNGWLVLILFSVLPPEGLGKSQQQEAGRAAHRRPGKNDGFLFTFSKFRLSPCQQASGSCQLPGVQNNAFVSPGQALANYNLQEEFGMESPQGPEGGGPNSPHPAIHRQGFIFCLPDASRHMAQGPEHNSWEC